MREPFTLQVSHLCQEMFFFILPKILKARKNLFFCRYSNIENNFFLEKSDILYLLKIPENVSNAKFKRCAIVHVELYKVCKKKKSALFLIYSSCCFSELLEPPLV